MAQNRTAGARIVPLERWAPVHPAAIAAQRGTFAAPAVPAPANSRSAALAEALDAANTRWGNPVGTEIARWLAGAEVVVTGQQPGLLGGPLLTLVKACAVAAEVRRRCAAGRQAVGVLWLATGDDDLEEMGWGRVVAGDEVAEVREPGWKRGGALGGTATLSAACGTFLDGLRTLLPGQHASAAIDVASECYRPGVTLGAATATFLARLLGGTGIVLVDSLELEIARAAAPLLERVLRNLPACWGALDAGGRKLEAQGWAPPLRISPRKLPLFRRVGDHRVSVATAGGACEPALVEEVVAHPERFVPNAWLRPLVQDASLGTAAAVLGGAELAYHLQTVEVREVAGIGRPEWVLRPHVTIVTAAERRLAGQLRVEPEQLLRSTPPAYALPGKTTRKRLQRLRTAVEREIAALSHAATAELPSLAGDVEATTRKLDAAVRWLEGRASSAASHDAEVEMGRWRRLRAFVRPDGAPQERRLSVLAPLLRLGPEWSAQLVAALELDTSEMQLLFWEDGGLW
jgi:uncharacterized protein YllA (UPF0747 family)